MINTMNFTAKWSGSLRIILLSYLIINHLSILFILPVSFFHSEVQTYSYSLVSNVMLSVLPQQTQLLMTGQFLQQTA